MHAQKMFVSLIPWVVFTIVINRRGADAAAIAAIVAAMLSLFFLAKDSRSSRVKVIDVTGIATFGALAVLSFCGGQPAADWVADYGRGAAALVLAAIMLGSVITMPFTEQYARESVPPEHCKSPVFRAVNRKISALWGGVVAVMGIGHLLAGSIDPASHPVSGARPVDLVLNWALPILLVFVAIQLTQKLSSTADNHASTPTASPGEPAAQYLAPQRLDRSH